MAQDLHLRCDRPNVMVKIPATRAGLPAIRHMIGEEQTHQCDTHLRGRPLCRGRRVVSVRPRRSAEQRRRLASGRERCRFFVSRVDTKVDKLLAARIEAASTPRKQRELRGLVGKAGIANSKMAYARYQELVSGPRWQAIEARAGTRVQRCLWG